MKRVRINLRSNCEIKFTKAREQWHYYDIIRKRKKREREKGARGEKLVTGEDEPAIHHAANSRISEIFTSHGHGGDFSGLSRFQITFPTFSAGVTRTPGLINIGSRHAAEKPEFRASIYRCAAKLQLMEFNSMNRAPRMKKHTASSVNIARTLATVFRLCHADSIIEKHPAKFEVLAARGHLELLVDLCNISRSVYLGNFKHSF